MAFPYILLAIAIVAGPGPGLRKAMIAIAEGDCIVIDIAEFLLGRAADSELRSALAYLRRARRALTSRTGTAWVGWRRRRRTSS
jgi:hypothetical protein